VELTMDEIISMISVEKFLKPAVSMGRFTLMGI
jgi:hypothetical protein